jgi:hypothetical protein
VTAEPDGSAVTMTVDATLRSLAGDELAVSGSLTTPPDVYCLTVTPDCGWLHEPPPYASAYCEEATAGFPEGSWR